MIMINSSCINVNNDWWVGKFKKRGEDNFKVMRYNISESPAIGLTAFTRMTRHFPTWSHIIKN